MKHFCFILFFLIIFIKIYFLTASSKLTEYEVLKITNLIQTVKPLLKLNSNATNFSMHRDVRKFNFGSIEEDNKLSVTELIGKYGYKTEDHAVITKDGYVLTCHRIPNKGPVVFLMHGLFGSADDWILTGPDNSLAYYLASKGFDVWMGNARGSKHSRKHLTLKPDCEEFWDFSWDEVGRYDLPAMIDYILKLTDHAKLTYIGHSQGTTSSFVLLSELQEYNDKICLVIALSPMAWMSHANSPVIKILSLSNPIDHTLLKAIGRYEVKPEESAVRAIADILCGDNEFSKTICSNYALLITGMNRKEIDFVDLPVIFSHFPAGTATKVLDHYAQVMDSIQFRRYDYGLSRNLKEYGSILPPDYLVENIKAPVALFYSDSDWLSNEKDVATLKDRLQNVVDYRLVENYSNIDFVWAMNVKDVLYTRILELINKHRCLINDKFNFNVEVTDLW